MRDHGRRLAVLEMRLPPMGGPVEITPELWRHMAAWQAAMLVHVFGPAAGDPFGRLYAAIATGNHDADICQSWRAGLRARFGWAVYRATIAKLGTRRSGDWLAVEVPEEVLAPLLAAFDPALADRHPDLVYPDQFSWGFEDYHAAKGGKVWRGGVEISGPVAAAFAPEKWEDSHAL